MGGRGGVEPLLKRWTGASGGGMKTGNLLPQGDVMQGHRQKLMRVHIAAMVLLGTAMYSVSWLGRQKLIADEARRDGLARQLEALPDPETDLRSAEADLHRLEELRLARKELGNTVPMS